MSTSGPQEARKPDDRASYILGTLTAVPISYPSAPYYILAFSVLFICVILTLVHINRPLNRTVIFVAAMGILLSGTAIFSNLISPYQDLLNPARTLTTSLFYLFFTCGLAINNHARFFKGFVDVMVVQAIMVIIASFFYLPWSAGVLVLSVPEFRLWGANYFPDWPNFYCSMLSVALILAITVQRRWLAGLLCLIAALLTTSRTVFLAVAILATWYVVFRERRYPTLRLVIMVVVLLIGVGLGVAVLTGAFKSGLSARLFLISDRLTILWSAFDIMRDHLLLGVGGVLLDYRVGNLGAASFHNSYLEVAVRMGLVGLIMYLPLILLPLFLLRWSDTLIPVILFLLVASMFQNLLKHPHIAIIFSVLIAWAGVKRSERKLSTKRPPVPIGGGSNGSGRISLPEPRQI